MRGRARSACVRVSARLRTFLATFGACRRRLRMGYGCCRWWPGASACVRVSARLRTGICARSEVPCVSACNVQRCSAVPAAWSRVLPLLQITH